MKKLWIIALMAIMTMCLAAFTGCGDSDHSAGEDSGVKATCSNGVMIGQEENGVASYLGIPYAKPPVGELRWKAPVAAVDSDEEIVCDHFGYTPLQYEWPTEPASYEEKSEDCLTLNVWTSTEESDTPKSVMFWIHGGSNAWGGTADPIYNGQKFVEAHPDIVLVTTNYRLGMMSWADFSKIPGGEEYTDINLGLRDQICALEWVQKNIEAFGGNPDEVTIFGESAGAGNVSALMVSPMAEGLFNKVIAESGTFTYLSGTREEAQEFAATIAKATGCKTMDELLALSEEEVLAADTEYSLGDESCGVVYDGVVMPNEEDVPDAVAAAADRGIKLMHGATADEMNYFMVDAWGETKEEKFADWKSGLDATWNEFAEADAESKNLLDQFYQIRESMVPEEYASDAEVKEALIESALPTELFRESHIQLSDMFSDAGGEAYMYYWGVPSTSDDYFKSACHAIELCYVFNNTEDTIYSGDNPDEATAEKTHTAWANFAKTGNPSQDGIEWTAYNSKDKNMMDIELSGWEMKNDPTKDQRVIIEKLLGE